MRSGLLLLLAVSLHVISAAGQGTLSSSASSSTVPTAPAASPVPYKLQDGPLDTPWTTDVGTSPWPEHPRPQLRRDAWKNLNGIWTYQPANGSSEVNSPPAGAALKREILIPSCIESAISGIMTMGVTNMWFATTFTVPSGWDQDKVLLHFEAIDYQATVRINGAVAGNHTGGYFRFTIDATEFLNMTGPNELLVFVTDTADLGPTNFAVGKQSQKPSHIFYTPCSGIWQTVWLESAPSSYITQLDVAADMHGGVAVTVHGSSSNATSVEVAVIDSEGKTVAFHQGTANGQFNFTVANPSLWSPDQPNLYNLTVTMGKDVVNSYTGFRTISQARIDDIQRPLLNGEFVFQFGTLDQGFWPDGIYLAPTLEALMFDLKELKKLGMNMIRKHVKVEPDLFYHACDTLGLMVFQDMPSMTNSLSVSAADQAEWERQIAVMVEEHKSYPCIVTWIIYNEDWGQNTASGSSHEIQISDSIRTLDPTRLVDAVSGWVDHGAGDYHDVHHYSNPQCGAPISSDSTTPYDNIRIGFQGEFGGLGNNVSIDHLWNVQDAIDTIPQTYEIDQTLEAFNFRAHIILSELRDQINMYACSGAVYTQTTDVEGEVNGLLTYDRRLERVNVTQWQNDIQSLYAAAAARGGAAAAAGRKA